MSTQTVRKFHWFWPWQDQQEQAWLEKMSGEGLHLCSVLPFGVYQLEPGQPQSFIYMLDFITSGSDRAGYFQERRDAGWEHVAEIAGWQYFRRAIEAGENPVLYFDNKMIVQKYRRFLAYLVIFLPIWFILLNRGTQTSSVFIQFLAFSLMLLLIITVLKLMQRIRRLEKR